MEKIIDIKAASINSLLKILLQDKSSKKNIIWATDTYAEYGEGFLDYEQINAGFLVYHANIIKPRIKKALEAQVDRTRKRAEVFTPAWLCNKMNNHCDEEWFGRKNIFNIENDDNTWTVIDEKIEFDNGTWQEYVDSRRLEITCGEAPYLVSRYDASSGEFIEYTKSRIGILDRKLRIVNENTDDYDTWIKWALRAFESVYGYEYQGDNLLIARINMLLAFTDYYEERWKREPDDKLLNTVAKRIVWNIWQMDGLKATLPLGKPYKEYYQISFFDNNEDINGKDNKAILCKIYDWRKNSSILFKKLEDIKMGKKMFDYIIGNPPYQESDGGAGVSATPVYNKFIDAIKKLNPDIMSFIIPAKWYSGGKGLDKFREDILNDSHIVVLEDYTNSIDVFPGVDVAGGVCYFIRDNGYSGKCKYTNHFNGVSTSALRALNETKTFIRYPLALNIVQKALKFNELTLDNVVSVRKPFGLPTTTRPLDNGDIIIRCNGGSGPYLRSKVLSGINMIDKWKIIISRLTAEHAGQPDKNGQFRVLSTMEKLGPAEICSETYLVAGYFDTELEADNYMGYLKTKFARFLLQQIAMTQQLSRTTFGYVPEQDFKESWNDSKLYNKYQLSKDEIEFIEKIIKEMS